MDNAIEQSFKISLSVLRFLGIHSYENSSSMRKLCILIPFFQTVSIVFLGFVNLLVEKQDNLMELNKTFIFVIEASSLCIRSALFFKFSAKVKNCVNYFGQPCFRPKDEKEKRMVKNCVWICHRNSKIFATAVFVAVFLCCLQQFLKDKKGLALNVWLPFDLSSSFVTYCGSTLYTDASIFYLGCIAMSIDPLLGGLVHQATTQLSILKYNLRNFRNLGDVKEKIKFEIVYELLQRCIEHHNAILQFVVDFEDCFSWIIFSQIGASTLGLCFSCIGITVVDVKSLDFLQFAIIYCVMVGQIVFYCFYGTLLLEESKTLNEAVYLGPWYVSDVRTRKVLMILMERAKKPLVITAGKVIELTLATLIVVIKTSFSLITVFKK